MQSHGSLQKIDPYVNLPCPCGDSTILDTGDIIKITIVITIRKSSINGDIYLYTVDIYNISRYLYIIYIIYLPINPKEIGVFWFPTAPKNLLRSVHRGEEIGIYDLKRCCSMAMPTSDFHGIFDMDVGQNGRPLMGPQM